MPPSPQHNFSHSVSILPVEQPQENTPQAANDELYGQKDPEPLTEEKLKAKIKACELVFSLKSKNDEEGKKKIRDEIVALQTQLASLITQND